MNCLKVSANEFTVTIRKACIGAGVARGVADDIAGGALAAASRGLVILPSLLDALDAFIPKQALWSETTTGWTTDIATALNDAPSMVDLATTGHSVSVTSLDQPVLLLGCALSAHDTFAIRFGTSDWQDCASISAQPSGPCAIHLRLTQADKPVPQASALSVLQADWNALKTHERKILVPTDDATRGDAGAGTNDND